MVLTAICTLLRLLIWKRNSGYWQQGLEGSDFKFDGKENLKEVGLEVGRGARASAERTAGQEALTHWNGCLIRMTSRKPSY